MSYDNVFNSSGPVLRSTTRSALKQFEAGEPSKKFGPEPSNKVASFVKVLSGDFSQNLQIPEEFTRNFNGHIPHRFIIESATTNKCWRIKAEKDEDGKIYFGYGWYDFVDENSLEVGNFLVFECEEQSIFQVKIYGRNGCLKTTLKENTQNGEDHAQNSENHAQSSENHALGKSTEIDEEIEIDAVKYEQEISKNQCEQKTRISSPNNHDHGMYKKKNAGDRTYKRTAKVSITENSVRFSVTFNRKKTYQFTQLTLPRAISSEKKLWSKEKLLLENVKGKCWPVKLAHKRAGFDVFCNGWKDFVRGNEIAAGDTLNFEFITDDLIRVDIARASPVGKQFGAKCQNEEREYPSLNGAFYEPVVLTPNNKQVEPSIAETNVSSGLRNSFSIMWRNTTTGGYLHIPKSVAESQNLKDKESVILRDPEGKCWPLQVRTWCDGRMALSKGWSDFWKARGITSGDSLSFEFISECLLQVTINRGNPLKNVVEGAETYPGTAINSIKIDTEEGDKLQEAADDGESAMQI